MMDDRGTTYIETIIAFAIFVISVSALLSIFLQAGLNYRYSTDRYEASLIAESILEDVSALLPKKSAELVNSDYIPMSVFLGGVFSEYQTGSFNITLLLKRMTTAEINNEIATADITVSTSTTPDRLMTGFKLSAPSGALFETSATTYAVMVVVQEANNHKELCRMVDLCVVP